MSQVVPRTERCLGPGMVHEPPDHAPWKSCRHTLTTHQVERNAPPRTASRRVRPFGASEAQILVSRECGWMLHQQPECPVRTTQRCSRKEQAKGFAGIFPIDPRRRGNSELC